MTTLFDIYADYTSGSASRHAFLEHNTHITPEEADAIESTRALYKMLGGSCSTAAFDLYEKHLDVLTKVVLPADRTFTPASLD